MLPPGRSLHGNRALIYPYAARMRQVDVPGVKRGAGDPRRNLC
jgi:hypothetical protein